MMPKRRMPPLPPPRPTQPPARLAPSTPPRRPRAPRRYPAAVLIDNGFVYAISRRLFARVDYVVLRDTLVEALGLDAELTKFFCWTSAPMMSERDDRFERFQKSLRDALGPEVYPSEGPASYLADVRDFTTGLDKKTSDQLRLRLQRHDAQLGYLIGSLREDHEIVAVTDSAQVIEALAFAARKRGDVNTLAAPRTALRQPVIDLLQRSEGEVRFLDLDPFVDRILVKEHADTPDRRRVPTI